MYAIYTIPESSPASQKDFQVLGEILRKVGNYIISPKLQSEIILLKVVFILISALFLFLIFYFLTHTNYLYWHFKSFRDFLFPKEFVFKKRLKIWQGLEKRIRQSKTEAQWKETLIDALNTLSNILAIAGYAGKNVSQQIKVLTKEELPYLDSFIEAVRECQAIVHNPQQEMKKSRAVEIINIFKESLKRLELL